MNKYTFDANGTFKIESGAKTKASALYVSGDTGLTLVLGYTDPAAKFVPLTDGSLAIEKQYKVEHGKGHAMYLKITGITTGKKAYVTVVPID